MAKQTAKKTTKATTPRKRPRQPADAPQMVGVAAGAVDVSPAPTPTTTPAVATTRPVTFVLMDLNAHRVFLSGEFNGWSADQTPLKRNHTGHWETTLDLPPGRYQYKFVVDGQWIPDPSATEYVYNPHGTLNSVIEVRA